MKGFYTAKEAREKLEVSEDKFQYMVQKNQVKKVILPGRKYGVYPQSDIDILAGTLNHVRRPILEVEEEKNIFRVARQEDAIDMYKLGERVMYLSGGNGVLAENLLPFLQIPYSEIGHVLIKNGNLMGYFTIIPLTYEKLMQRMKNELTISQISPKELASFEPGKPISCFIWEVISDPDQKHMGAYLIKKLLRFFHTLGKRGVEIEGIYAIASSIEGIYLCRRMGMHEMNLPDILKSDRISFVLKIQEQKNWLTKNYIQALRSYKIHQAKLE